MAEEKKKDFEDIENPEEEIEETEEAENQEDAEADAESENAGAESEAEEKEVSEEDEAWSSKYMRLMADFQNFKKRTEKEKADVYSFANEKIVTDLLTVLDNFERALAQECSDEAFANGMKLIFKQFDDVLTKSGLAEIEAQGQEFDPSFHHAVLTDDNPDYESGQVTEVLQKGYTLNEKVIRPAMVKVNN